MLDKIISYGLIVLGVVVILVSLLADVLGIGPHPGLGIYQLGEAGLGLILAFAGVWLLRKHKS